MNLYIVTFDKGVVVLVSDQIFFFARDRKKRRFRKYEQFPRGQPPYDVPSARHGAVGSPAPAPRGSPSLPATSPPAVSVPIVHGKRSPASHILHRAGEPAPVPLDANDASRLLLPGQAAAADASVAAAPPEHGLAVPLEP